MIPRADSHITFHLPRTVQACDLVLETPTPLPPAPASPHIAHCIISIYLDLDLSPLDRRWDYDLSTSVGPSI